MALARQSTNCMHLSRQANWLSYHNFLRNDEDWLEALVGEGGDDVEPESAAESYQPIFSRREELYFYLSELPDTAIN